MKKWIFSILLAICMVAVMATAASAAEEECTCLIKCTEGHMDADCPVCSKAGAAVGDCKGRVAWSGELCGDLQLQAIMNLDQTNQTTYYFPLSDDITIAPSMTEITVPQGADVVLDLNGHTVSRKGDGAIFAVSGKLTIMDSVGTGKLTKATNGALDIREGGYVLMQGGSIESNITSADKYAIYVYVGTFEMTGGTIKNNITDAYEAPMNIHAVGSTVIIDGDAQILCCDQDVCSHAASNSIFMQGSTSPLVRAALYLDGGKIKGNLDVAFTNINSRHAGAGTVVNGNVHCMSVAIYTGTYTGKVDLGGSYIFGGTFLGTVNRYDGGGIQDSAKVPVKFVTDAGRVIATVKVLRGQGIAAEDIPTVSDPTTYGYSYFAGWSIGSEQYYAGGGQFVDNVNYVTAKFGNPIKYTLSIDLEGGTASNPTTYTADDTITLVNPTKEGYIFIGWSGTGLAGNYNMTVTIPKGSTGDRTYTAHYIESSISVSDEDALRNGIAFGVTTVTLQSDITLTSELNLSDKTVTLDLNGHTLTGNVKLADTSAAPQSVLTLQDSSTAGGGVLDGNIELTRGGGGTASRLYANGGTVTGTVSMNSYVAGIYCTSDTPTAFQGYVGSSGEIHGGIFYGSVNESNIVGKTVTFMSEGSRYALEVVDSGSVVVEPVIPPLKAGYGKLKGWYNGETKYTFGSALSEDMTLTAVFTLPLHYTITYELNGGSVSSSNPIESNPTEYFVTSDDITLINPTRDGYMFTGWGGTDLEGTSNMTVTIPKGSTGDRTYTAYYLKRPGGDLASLDYFYTVVYDTQGGSPVEPKTVWLGDTSKVEVLDGVSTTRAGYRSLGWYCGSMRIALQGTTVKDLVDRADNGVITLTAKWIEKNTVSFNTAAQDCTYDGTEKAFEIKDTTLDGFNVTYRQNGNTVTNPTDAGLYDVIITREEEKFYKAVNETVKSGLVIGPKEVTVTIDSIPDETYTGSDIEPTVTVYDGETVIPANEYTVEYTDNRNVGTATVTLTDNTDGNYTAISGSATFTIKPKTVTATISAIPDKTYTGSEIAPTVTAYDGETEIPASEYTVVYSNNINAGTATVTLTDKTGGNYTVSGSKTFEIKPKTVTATISAIPDETYTGSEIEPTVTAYDGETEIPASEYTVEYTDNINAGTATVTLTDKAGGNYTVGGSTTFTIKPKEVTATISAIPDETYTGSEIAPTVTVYDGETEIPASEYTVVYSNNRNVGTATVTLTDKAGGNYTVSGSKTFEIKPKSIEDAVLTPSETLIYNGTEQTQNVTVALDGFDAVTFDVSGNKQTDVNTTGDYTLTVTANGNFKGTKTLDWNIAPAAPIENPAKKTTARVARNKTLADASVTEGELLALDGTTPLAGTFAWVDSTKVMRANGTEQMTFTPENTNYAPITIDVAVSTYSSGGGSGGVAAPASYTVRFDTNGGSSIASQTVAENGKVTSPANPTKEGYIFDGWYTDNGLTEKYDFAAGVTKNMTLYAKWVKEESKKPFTDIQEDDWFYEDVAYVYESGLMTGTSTTTFSPNATTTRGMVVTILYRLEGSPAVGSSCPFNDIASNAYYKDAAAWAVANGIAGGYGNALFGPNDSITREQLAALLYRYAKYKGLDVSVGEETDILSYNDAQSISAYAFPAMQWLCDKGILQGIDGNLMPAESATRAQIAALLHRFCETVLNG